jgi:hypothetical protein
LCGRGNINTYAIFTEFARSALNAKGFAGVIVPKGIATDSTYQFFFQELVDRQSLVELIGFENEEFIFPEIAHVVQFCTLVICGEDIKEPSPRFAFFLRNAEQLFQRERYFTLTSKDFELLNPHNTDERIQGKDLRGTILFRSRHDAELTKHIYRQAPILLDDGPEEKSPWEIEFLTMFHMSGDSALFYTKDQLDGEWQLHGNIYSKGDKRLFPLYEGKLFWHYDHRFASFEFTGPSGKGGFGVPSVPLEFHLDPNYVIQPRYWVEAEEVQEKLRLKDWRRDWLIAFRDIASAKVLRTFVLTTIPLTAVGNKAPILLPRIDDPRRIACLIANLSSLVFDYAVRQKVGGTNLNFFIVKQFPVLPPNRYSNIDQSFVVSRVVELTYTSWDLRDLARDMGYYGPPFHWNEQRRAILQTELDACFAHLYGIRREDLLFILDPANEHGPDYPSETFRLLKEYETKEYGEYRTQRLVLEGYDSLAEAMATGQSYQTRLDPPPAHPDAAHPWDEAYLGPELPRDQWWQEGSEGVGSEGVGSREKRW